MRPILDPWIEGYLDYQLELRRLRPLSVRDMRCTLRRTVLMMAKYGALVQGGSGSVGLVRV